MKTRRLLAAGLILAATACAGDLVGPPPSTDYASLFDTVWREFDLHYSFFELKGIDWNAVGARHRAQAIAATSDRAFANELMAMFDELRDPHVSLTPFGPGSTMRWVGPYDTVPSNFSERATLARYVPGAAMTPGNHIHYGMAAAGVGYLRIPNFLGLGWAGEVDDALAAIPGASSLIIDVRGNGGGSQSVALGIAGRFADRERTIGYIRYRSGPGHGDFTDYIPETVQPQGRRFSGPVYVLTNRGDYSSAEDFVLAMRTFPQVTIMGDTTGGASGGPIVRELPNGWTYELSQWIEYTPDKKVFEGVGLVPSVVVRPTPTTLAAGRDPVVDQALTLAGATP